MNAQAHPHTIIFSLYGQYVLPRGGEIWTGSLIRALAPLGFSEGAVRALVSRMQRKGLLQSRRAGRRSFYRLTGLGLKDVRWGSERAFASRDAGAWDERWTMVAYSIPEEHRGRRGALRRSLSSWGFGSLAPGIWISPHLLSPEAEEKWRALDVWGYLEIFRAEHLGPSNVRALVVHAWPQLPVLGDHYRAYVAEYEPTLRRFEAGILNDEQCFAANLRSLIDFVAITLGDPALPPSLLPQDWARPSARLLFKELQRALAEPAERFFDAIYETKGDR